MVASIMVIGALPASAAINTSASCPSSTPSAGFTDIGGLDATTQLAINCLVDYGISNGTSATTYSPAGEVSRWQMALFLTRQAEVHGITLPSGADQGFTDIGAFNAETTTAINQLAQLDITKGTSATTFSPNDVVTRWQMALFLTRLVEAAGVTLPSGVAQGFTDIGGLDAETQTAINQTKQLGIADGTSATTYNPLASTLRWQMALFLTRTLAADGVLPTGHGFVITAHDAGTEVITYDDNGTSRTVDYTPGTSFTVDGVPATRPPLSAAVTVGDLNAFS
ncbi:MAG TPA: S-layer homology domain-containing protein, partial [Acidimicrobiia bacterium]|nr:S-layer homology domain-containing protein [Acidimicrobiia bacterium]